MPILRRSLATGELHIDGILPPALSTVSTAQPMALQQQGVKKPVNAGPMQMVRPGQDRAQERSAVATSAGAVYSPSPTKQGSSNAAITKGTKQVTTRTVVSGAKSAAQKAISSFQAKSVIEPSDKTPSPATSKGAKKAPRLSSTSTNKVFFKNLLTSEFLSTVNGDPGEQGPLYGSANGAAAHTHFSPRAAKARKMTFFLGKIFQSRGGIRGE